MSLPKDFVDRNLKEAKGSLFYGVPIEDLTRDELIACCVAGWRGLHKQREEHSKQLDFLSGTSDADV